MKLKLLAVGTRMPDWVNSGFKEYCKRMPAELKVELIEVPINVRGRNPSNQSIENQGRALLKNIDKQDFAVALDVVGKSLSTEALASQLTNWQMNGQNLCLMIGGPDGLSADCLTRANMKWSLSDLTLPHPMVRILVMEQLYRAWTINSNHPYHRS
ncbi:MAG: 23S rRNA (pseudouridine(1915)-N(3))-methyltransferase RlmH [Porticoccaceae bacterium]|nr:23S rRNA (pseudouridine(1915)-N(3))-methyltransferase RlmH [Porticoccaceae bacterium]